MPFEFHCRYHFWVSYKKDLNSYLKSKTAKDLSFKLQNLMTICYQNFYYAQKLQNQAYYKKVKPQSYALVNKI